MTAIDPTFDVVVLGAGPAGEALAGALRERERDRRMTAAFRAPVGPA